MKLKVNLSNISVTHKQHAWNYLAAVPKDFSKVNSYGKLVSEDGKSFPSSVIDGELFTHA